MSSKTKTELQDDAISGFDTFLERATKADLQTANKLFADPKAFTPQVVAKIALLDPSGHTVTFDLGDGKVYHDAARQVYENAVTVEGSGSILTLDLTSMFLSPMNAIDFANNLTAYPIKATFSGGADEDPPTRKAPEAEPEEDAAPEEAPAPEPEPAPAPEPEPEIEEVEEEPDEHRSRA